MAIKNLIICLTLAAAVFISGCSSTTVNKIPDIDMNRVVFLDSGLSQALSVETTGARRSDAGTVEAVAMLRNKTSDPVMILARVQFFDERKMQVEEPTAWRRMFIPPKSIETFRDFSTSVSDVKYYLIEINSAGAKK